MNTTPIKQNLLKTPILADGALGTQLHARGVRASECFDALNINNPDLVSDVHRIYLEAGVDLIETNTFGANRYKLSSYGLEEKVVEINCAGVDLARRVIDDSLADVIVAGSVGPLGVRLSPYGRVKVSQASEAFRQQIGALVRTGVDALILETFSNWDELVVAVNVAQEIIPDDSILLIASISLTYDHRTLLGDDVARSARELAQLGVDVIGVNCSSGPEQLMRALRTMKQAAPDSLFSVMPNAGWPERVGGRTMYPAPPEYFGKYAQAFVQGGAVIVGGCCGTTPAHISSMRSALDMPTEDWDAIPKIRLDSIREETPVSPEGPTQLAQKLASDEFIVGVELTPPRGYTPHKLLNQARVLVESGIDVVNIADTPLARMGMSGWAVAHMVQEELGVEAVLHFPTRGRNLLRVQGDLLAAHALSVRNLFVVMGDPTAMGDHPQATNSYDVVPSGLINLIKRQLNAGWDHAGQSIGQPTSFVVGCAANLTPEDPEREIKVMHRKIISGADFALTQPVFDVEMAQQYVMMYEQAHGFLQLPILVGVMPLYSERHAYFLQNEVPGMTLPASIIRRLGASSDESAEGVRIALELLEELRGTMGVRGVYLMPPFGHYEIVSRIMQKLDR